MEITQDILEKIAQRLDTTFQDVVFINGILAFCDFSYKEKSEWSGDVKIDAEMCIYKTVRFGVPCVGDEVRLYGMMKSKKDDYIYHIVAIADRTNEGFGYVCGLEKNK